jgi:uncharacterized protein
MPNQLIHETSPYLLQHAHNPVDWMPWGPKALEKAVKEDKPIFLSIGYAACHWCHVMEHESFENPETARLMNEHFVSIKVDREERPDLDSLYMNAVTAMTGSGGWPMSVFLTPEGHPFYGGTYFPPTRRYGMPAFQEVLMAAALAWQNDRAELRKTGNNLVEHLIHATAWSPAAGGLRANLLEQAVQSLLSGYDWQRGGWGQAPLFPQPMSIEFLLLQATRGNRQALEAARHSLQAMCQGGMYDLVGGGFHRYSTDDAWLVPHFEKMLYDNAQLALAYLHGYLLTGEEEFRRVCEETLDFIQRELASPQGGFYSSLDADSEGEEGKFYLWSLEEVRAALEPLGCFDLFHQVYTLNAQGNFEGRTILHRQSRLASLASALDTSEQALVETLGKAHQALLALRDQRVRPATDDKVLTAWNGLALRAFAEAGRYLNRPDYIELARQNASFLLEALHPADRLLRSWRDGQARQAGFLEDYAALILGLLALYQSDPDPRWYSSAAQLAREMIDAFQDPAGGFFDTRQDQAGLFTRPKDNQDNATPCGNALAALALFQLAEYSGDTAMSALGEAGLLPLQDALVRHPAAFGLWLQAADFLTGPIQQAALVGVASGEGLQTLVSELWSAYRPRLVAAVGTGAYEPSQPELLKDRPTLAGQATAYICQGFVCSLPVQTPQALREQLNAAQPKRL